MGEAEYLKIRSRLSAVLKRDAGLHKLKAYAAIGAGYMEVQSTLRLGGDQRYQKLIVALNFWTPGSSRATPTGLNTARFRNSCGPHSHSLWRPISKLTVISRIPVSGARST